MKDNKYKVCFANCNYKDEFEMVFALNQNDALILAQAERIKQGRDYTLDRINVDKNYERGNLRWATRLEQVKNRR